LLTQEIEKKPEENEINYMDKIKYEDLENMSIFFTPNFEIRRTDIT
jgi:hypothetical protein